MSYHTSITILRFNPDTDSSPLYKEYILEYEQELSVLNALRVIYETIDPTLAFRNYQCSKGICKSCMIKIDGSPRRACQTFLDGQEEVILEPLDGYTVIRDLVTDFSSKREELERHG